MNLNNKQYWDKSLLISILTLKIDKFGLVYLIV